MKSKTARGYKKYSDFSEAQREKKRQACRDWHSRRTPEQIDAEKLRAKLRWASLTPEQRTIHRENKRKWHASQPTEYKKAKSKKQVEQERALPEERRTQLRQEHIKRYILREYGLTPEQHATMLRQQGYVCAICKRVNENGKALAVDHDHKTGEVRGLLCFRCNMGLGYFQDSPGLLTHAGQYLLTHTVKAEGT